MINCRYREDETAAKKYPFLHETLNIITNLIKLQRYTVTDGIHTFPPHFMKDPVYYRSIFTRIFQIDFLPIFLSNFYLFLTFLLPIIFYLIYRRGFCYRVIRVFELK
jgi:hypothetical protein